MGSDQVSFNWEERVSDAHGSTLLVESGCRDGSMAGDSEEARV